MALVYKDISIDVNPGKAPQTIHVSQYDINRQFNVTLTDDGTPLNIPAGITAVVEGSIGRYSFRENATVSNNVVTFILSEAMTANKGKVWTKIKLTEQGHPLSTCAFWLDVDRAGVEAGNVIGAVGFDQQLKDGVAEYMDAKHLDDVAFLPMGRVPSGTDLDTLTASGHYLVAGSSNFQYEHNPLPAGHTGVLLVYKGSANYGTQVMHDMWPGGKLTYRRSRGDQADFSAREWAQITGEPALLMQPDNNYSSCNDVNESCVIYLIENSSVAPWFSDFPFDGSGLLITVKAFNGLPTKTQTAISFKTNSIKRRRCSVYGVWEEWSDNKIGKKYVAFGDSLTWGSVWNPTSGGNLHQVKELWRIPTRIAIAAGTEYNFANEGVGNIGFFAAVNGSTIISKVQNYNFANVGLVTIMGGTNDRYTIPLGTADDSGETRTICGAIRKCIKTISARNPSTQIVIMQPLPGGVDGSVDDVWNSTPIGAKWSVVQYDKEVSKLCHDEHVGYVNWVESSLCRNWKYVGYNGSDTPNYNHPTDDEAYLLLGEFIAGKIRALTDCTYDDYPEELYEKFVPDIVDGKFIHKEDGTERSGSEYTAATTYLYVRGGTKIHVDHIFCQLNASISVYTIQHDFIAAIAHDITEDSITFTLPENAACIRITSPIGIQPVVYVERERNNALIFAQDRLSLGTLTENSFISKIDGSVRTDTTTYSVTDYIPVQSGYYQVINPMLRMQAGICAYDSQQNFIACLLSDNMAYGQFYVDSSVSYIRCSVLSNYSYAFWVEKIPKNAYEEQTSYSDSWQKATDGRVDSPFSRISSLEPTITIIDDDTTNIEYVERYHDICEEMGVKGNYAVITSRLETVTGLKEKLLQYEDEGYGMLYHVYTQAGATYFQPGSSRDMALAEANYCKGVRQMREFGFTNYNYWISPYGVNDEDMQDLCKRHGAQCLISTYNNTFIRPNGMTGKGVAERYNIPRCSLGHNAERYPYFTIEMLKDQITQCASAHGWLIITTHVNEWGSSSDGDNRLKEVIQHALSNGCVFKTFAEAFEDRRALFTLNEIL